VLGLVLLSRGVSWPRAAVALFLLLGALVLLRLLGQVHGYEVMARGSRFGSPFWWWAALVWSFGHILGAVVLLSASRKPAAGAIAR
jgi:hypothetical protein